MGSDVDVISSSKDVGFLLTLLRMAKKQNEVETTHLIVKRMKEMGVLDDAAVDDAGPAANLQNYVNRILTMQLH